MNDLFEMKNIKPMLLSEIHEPFDSPDFIYELKLDGIRCVVYLDENGAEIRNKRNMRLNALYPELNGIFKQAKQRCILDGELLMMKNGKPDFYALQKRSMMSNRTKIEFAAHRLPVSFSAFDIVYVGSEQITDKPLMERKAVLQDTITENERLAVSRFIPDTGIAFFNLTAEQGLEGIVAKRKNSRYYVDKTTKDWVKIKNLKDDDFVVCGYIEKPNHIVSLILGAYSNGQLIRQGHVTLGVSGSAFEQIRSLSRTEPLFHESGDADAVWVQPVLVCTVQYMMRTADGSMRQPVFKGLRDDKLPKDCTAGNDKENAE